MPFPPMQSALKRPSAPSNMIARGNALPASPAYGNTTNVTGAQTAQQSVPRTVSGIAQQTFGRFKPGEYIGVDGAGQHMYAGERDELFPHWPTVSFGPDPNQSAGSAIGNATRSALGVSGDDDATAQAKLNAMQAFMKSKQLPASPDPGTAPNVAYPGGDAPGIAAYYRNSALNNYQSQTAKQIDGLVAASQAANPPAVAAPETAQQTLSRIQSTNQQQLQAQETARQQNTRGFASVLDPNRLRPEQMQQIAETSARQAGENDPTGLRGRMAGFGAGPGDTWYDRYEQAQLNQERADRAARAEARYNSPEKVQERAARSALKATPEYQQKIKDAKIRRDAAAQGYRDEHGGLSRRQVRRLEQYRRINQQQVRAGRISQEEADARMGYRADEFKSQAAAGQANKSALNATSLDRVRLPDGQLPAATREKAATTAKNLTDPNYKAPTPSTQKQAEIVQSLGLTNQMPASDASSIIGSTPVPREPAERKQYVAAIRKYWGSMRDSDNSWAQNGNPAVASLNRLAELPESEWNTWLDEDWPFAQTIFETGGQ